MNELISYKSPLANKWSDRFLEYARDPETDVANWVEAGVEAGIAEDSDTGRRVLAEQMGVLFSYIYDEETGAEKVIEDIDPQVVEKETGIDAVRVEKLGAFMVAAEIINSREKIESRKRVQK